MLHSGTSMCKQGSWESPNAYLVTKASHVSPFSVARLMILSSTSVKFRAYVTSYPD